MMKEMSNMSNSTFPTCNALSSFQIEMDGERNLQRNQFNDSKMQRTGSLQYVFPSFQNQQRNLSHKSRSTPNFNGKNARVYDDSDKYDVELYTLSIYEEFSSKQKEEKEDKEAQNEKVYEAKDISIQAFESDRKLDKHITTSTYRPMPNNCECLLENKSQENNCSIIQSINSGKTPTQKTYDHILTDDRSDQLSSTHSPSKSGSGSKTQENVLGSWQLLRDEYTDASKSSEAQHTNSHSYNRCNRKNSKVSLPKLQDVPYQLLDQLKEGLHDFTEKDQHVLNANFREHLAKTFGITKIFPLYLDYSEYVMWFLDENECLFLWNKMENSVIYTGSNLEEGITNYLIHPDRMCYVIDDTFERVSVNEYERRLDEEFKNHMEEMFKKQLLEAKANLVISKGKKSKK